MAMKLRSALGNGAMTLVMVMLSHAAIAQPISTNARNDCTVRTAEEMVVPTREITITGAGPRAEGDGSRTVFMRNTRTGQTAECRITYDGRVLSVTLTGGGNTTPPANATPTEGSFQGRGTASGAVFGRGRQTDASLDFNRGNFSVGLSVPPGTGAQVRYQGTINRLRSTNPNNPSSFVLEGRIRSFASSVNGLRVRNTSGNCRIEVFDARIVSSSCSANAPGSATQFRGMAQF